MSLYASPSDNDVEIGIECALPHLPPFAGTLKRTRLKFADKVAIGLTAALLVIGAWGMSLGRRDDEDGETRSC